MANNIEEQRRRINNLTNKIDATYHEAALRMGLSDSAMLILYTICNNGEECLLNDITHLCGISKQTINSAIRKLEKEDILYMETFCGRKKKIFLTDKGKTLVKDTVLHIIEIENEIFSEWTEAEQKIYMELNQKYLFSLREKVKRLECRK